MKRSVTFSIAFVLLAFSVVAAAPDGKADFDMYCSGCHPDGSNPVNPAKTLRKMTREANGVKTADDIVRIMRKPGEGMRAFTKRDIPENRAKAIADYVLKTF